MEMRDMPHLPREMPREIQHLLRETRRLYREMISLTHPRLKFNKKKFFIRRCWEMEMRDMPHLPGRCLERYSISSGDAASLQGDHLPHAS